MRQPRDITIVREYEPDMARMVKALQILLEWQPERLKGGENGGQGGEPERMEAKGTQNTDTKAG